MRYQIEKQGDDIVITFEDLGGNAQAVVDAIGRCRYGASTCSAGECRKIDNMASCDNGGALALRLTPRAELTLDPASIGECLKYHLPKHLGK